MSEAQAHTGLSIKLVTVSYDENDGLEIDFEGMNAYEAWAYLYHALDTVEQQLGEFDDDDD